MEGRTVGLAEVGMAWRHWLLEILELACASSVVELTEDELDEHEVVI